MVRPKKAQKYANSKLICDRLLSIPGIEVRGPRGRVTKWKGFYYDRWWMPVKGRYAFKETEEANLFHAGRDQL